MIPIERIQAAVNLLYPDDMTPNAKCVFDSIIEDEKMKYQEMCSRERFRLLLGYERPLRS